ncbi:hypothetical protein SAMN02799630_05102 [Paenibacillus sp. UNCCL117]|uniref:HAD family hydrolase n=1 Tax=unclassified Paenibacillus TaxID=185978 RepID=UPI00089055D5|nr:MULTISPECIES: HAD family hydrolase [unclassified Paenibacillus]SDE29896.1 hypothetical protein SAMN04488602_12455 [Paenibacillus sp. cl123]SFW63171.1 hypothetical protein SAMN02799630_05102 [Paenibacillus sp. UNCCL117]
MRLSDERLELWMSDRYLRTAARQAGAVRLLSLDIFDTLLLRACAQPSDVFLLTARRSAEAGLLNAAISAHEFRSARQAAERSARDLRTREAGHDEVTLEDIYAGLPDFFGPRRALMEIELAAEREVCYLNPHIVSLLEWCRARGVKIALLSDMYLSSRQLYELLAAAGLDRTAVDTLLVSGEHGINKSTGGLFELLMSLYPGIARASVLHIGDNERADVDGAARASIPALHYELVPEYADSPYHWESVRHPGALGQLRSLRKLAGAAVPPAGAAGSAADGPGVGRTATSASAAGRATGSASAEAAEAEAGFVAEDNAIGVADAGGVTGETGAADASDAEDVENEAYRRIGAEHAGPFLTALCDWVVDICLSEGRTEVHPLMREAVLLGPMLEQAARLRGVQLRVIPLYVSRQATYLAALERFGEEELDRLLLTGGTVRELLLTLGIPELASLLPVPVDQSLQGGGPACHEAASMRAALRERLLQPDMRSAVEHAIAESRRLLRAYVLRTAGQTDRLVTVDIGFHGTIQRSLHQALGCANRADAQLEPSGGEAAGSASIHLLAAGGSGIGELKLKHRIDIRCFLGSSGEHDELSRAFIRSPAFIEELSMGELGSTERYAENEQGEAVPVAAALDLPAYELAWKRAFQAGVLSFQQYYYAWAAGSSAGRRTATEPPSASDWFKPLHRLIDMPTPEEAFRLGRLRHRDNHFGADSRICEPVDGRWFAQGGLAFLEACSFDASVMNVYWPQGVLTLKQPYELYLHHLRQLDGYGRQAMLWRMCRQIDGQLSSSADRPLVLVGSGSFAADARTAALLHRVRISGQLDPSDSEAWRQALRRLEHAAECAEPLPLFWLATLSEAQAVSWKELLLQAVGRGDSSEGRRSLDFLDPFAAWRERWC